ncbi:MAG: NAD(P)-dependent oxidoreductase [Bacteroidales bacterium]|nr:NAD(P)-dependent oxidoreductase [Bacteroidales bacterium]
MKKVLVLDKGHSILSEKLLDAGFELDYYLSVSREQLFEIISQYSVLIVRSKLLVDKELIDRAVNLKVIGRIGAGMDAIDTDYAEKKGIVCLNSPEGNRDAVGEHCLGLLLALFNKICIADSQVRKGLWLREDNRGLEIKGKTVGIIGYGNMGQSFAKRLSGFDCKVIAYDKYKTNYSDAFAQEVSLEEIFSQSDILSFHTPLTSETKYMFNKDFISNFKKPFYLLNTSRGKVVNTKDLIEALNQGKILGAGLDVLEFEAFSNELENAPRELQDLFSRNNVVLTPHVAGWTVESNYKLSYYLAEKIISAL